MIPAHAQLRIERIPLERLQVREYQRRYPDRVLHYVKLLLDHPGEDAGLIHVTPSDTRSGMNTILDGHHKYVANIIAGREDALCVVVEEGIV